MRILPTIANFNNNCKKTNVIKKQTTIYPTSFVYSSKLKDDTVSFQAKKAPVANLVKEPMNFKNRNLFAKIANVLDETFTVAKGEVLNLQRDFLRENEEYALALPIVTQLISDMEYNFLFVRTPLNDTDAIYSMGIEGNDLNLKILFENYDLVTDTEPKHISLNECVNVAFEALINKHNNKDLKEYVESHLSVLQERLAELEKMINSSRWEIDFVKREIRDIQKYLQDSQESIYGRIEKIRDPETLFAIMTSPDTDPLEKIIARKTYNLRAAVNGFPKGYNHTLPKGFWKC